MLDNFESHKDVYKILKYLQYLTILLIKKDMYTFRKKHHKLGCTCMLSQKDNTRAKTRVSKKEETEKVWEDHWRGWNSR